MLVTVVLIKGVKTERSTVGYVPCLAGVKIITYVCRCQCPEEFGANQVLTIEENLRESGWNLVGLVKNKPNNHQRKGHGGWKTF